MLRVSRVTDSFWVAWDISVLKLKSPESQEILQSQKNWDGLKLSRVWTQETDLELMEAKCMDEHPLGMWRVKGEGSQTWLLSRQTLMGSKGRGNHEGASEGKPREAGVDPG